MARSMFGVILVATALGGCALSHERDGRDAVIGSDGRSDVVSFDVPEGARSITVVVDGDPGAIFAIGSLVLADGVERVGLEDPLALGERPGMPLAHGPQRQVPAFGSFAFQYPYVRSQPLRSGPATLRVASDMPGAAHRVRIFMPVGEARALHVSLVSMTSVCVASEEPAFVARARRILAAGGIDLIVDERIDLPPIGELAPTFPPVPSDRAGSLVEMAHGALSTDALPIVLVDLDREAGFVRGVPCPPDPTLDAHAVFVDATPDLPGDAEANLARVIAHEVAHALGLPHTEDFLPDGETLLDPFDDTEGFDATLMGSMDLDAPIAERILAITPEQRFAMTRSALLE